MAPTEDLQTTFSRAEMEVIKKIAERDGVSVEEAVTRLGGQDLARIVKKRTGHAPAKVYDIKRKKKDEA